MGVREIHEPAHQDDKGTAAMQSKGQEHHSRVSWELQR